MRDGEQRSPIPFDSRRTTEPGGGPAGRDRLPPFPWGQVLSVGGLILLHFALVIWRIENPREGVWLLRNGGLLAGSTAREPWRLVTSLFLHVDMRHAFWNGVSMMVFAVPLIAYLGQFRTALIYFGSGIGGGIAALAAAPEGTLILGSSGAVAGLFGAWVAVRLRSARYAEITWRVRVRAAGIGLLVLPALLNPMTPTGQPISVSSHLGGLITGMLVGAVLSTGLLPREEGAIDDEDEEKRDPFTS